MKIEKGALLKYLTVVQPYTVHRKTALKATAVLCTAVVVALACSGKHPENDTSETDTADTEGEVTDPETVKPELLYELLTETGNRVEISGFDVQGDYAYYTAMSSFNRLLKDGTGTRENLGFKPYAGRSQFMVAEEPFIYSPISNGVTRYDTENKEETVYDLSEYVTSIGLIAGDENRLYVGGDGSSLQISFDKDGNDLISYGVEKNPDYYGMAYVVTDDTYVYFSGGGRGETAGQILRVPKTGGDIEVVSTVPEVGSENYAHLGPQVGAMVVVEDHISSTTTQHPARCFNT